VVTLELARGRERLSVLALGAHSDDIEIGCGGTILRLAREVPELEVTWVVLSAEEGRREEARAGAEAFLHEVARKTIEVESFEDAFFKYGREVKEHFEGLKDRCAPDVVLTHYGSDLHQDHRLVSELTWNTFRDHLILEYEIPKYDGDLISPNLFVPISEELARRKVSAIMSTFVTQRTRHWFTEDLFMAMMRLRGMETNSPTRFAEAFTCRKAVLDLSSEPEAAADTATRRSISLVSERVA
jgi:LmbE family N-acetylglucosaminyl deacetylase